VLDDKFKRLNQRMGGHAFVETNKRMFGAWTHVLIVFLTMPFFRKLVLKNVGNLFTVL